MDIAKNAMQLADINDSRRMALTEPYELCPESPEESILLCGDAASLLRKFANEVVQTTMTSPPYWFVRDYGVDGQIGHEPTVSEYLLSLCDVFDEVWRVTRDDGVLWLNLGDGWTSGGRASRAPDPKNRHRALSRRPPTPPGLKPKDLLLLPARLVMLLQQPVHGCRNCEKSFRSLSLIPETPSLCPRCLSPRTERIRHGWHLRAEVIWERPNCQPESVKDRPTRSHEQVWLLSKRERYVYDSDAARGPNSRNLRTVWPINIERAHGGHVAPFPEALVEQCLLLTTRVGDIVLDPFVGSGTTPAVAKRLQRRAIGIDLNPAYIDVSCRRLHK